MVGRGFRRPAAYTEQLGGYERMLHKHLGLGITTEQRFRFASLMSLAADDAGMPAPVAAFTDPSRATSTNASNWVKVTGRVYHDQHRSG
jgi:truncated hemoglobin YjbI